MVFVILVNWCYISILLLFYFILFISVVEKIVMKFFGFIEILKEDGFSVFYLVVFNNYLEIVKVLLLLVCICLL